MPITVTMPRLSDTMEEGTLIKWRVKVGDEVKAGDVVADVETDKATMELPVYDDGTIARLALDEGDSLPVGELILVLAEEGESVEDAAAAGDGGGEKAAGGEKDETDEAKAADEAEAETDDDEKSDTDDDSEDTSGGGGDGDGGGGTAVAAPKTSSSGRVRISPVAQKMAQEHDLDIASIEGTGPDGRIIKRDILAAVEKGSTKRAPERTATPAAQPKLESKTISVSNMRKTIAKRLVESKTTIPHYQVTMQVDMDPLMDLRTTLNTQLESQGVKLSVNDFIVRAIALALAQHPVVNSSWTDKGIEQHGSVNVGIAVALPEEKGGGLVVPTLRDVLSMGLRAISAETRRLAKKAREQGLSIEEMSDGTFTLSNLGMFGVDQFNAIINPPQAAILAVGAAIEKPVVRDGQIVIGQEMACTLSADHRVIDGATGALFLQTLKQLLENPAALLV